MEIEVSKTLTYVLTVSSDELETIYYALKESVFKVRSGIPQPKEDEQDRSLYEKLDKIYNTPCGFY